MVSPPRCRLAQNTPEAAGAGGEALDQAVEDAAAAWDEASNGERAPFEEQAEGELPPLVWGIRILVSGVSVDVVHMSSPADACKGQLLTGV
jgi:hypothetical protein